MLGSAPASLWLAVFVTPGWFAVRGWHAGREEPLPTPLAEWVPLALAIGATWSGAVALACPARTAAIAASGSMAVRVATWLGAAAVLWLVPFGLSWLAGRVSRKRRGRTVTVVLKSGAAIVGTFRYATATELTLADATVEARRYELITINRSDAELVMHSRHAVTETAAAQPPSVSRGPRQWSPLVDTTITIGLKSSRPFRAGSSMPLCQASVAPEPELARRCSIVIERPGSLLRLSAI